MNVTLRPFIQKMMYSLAVSLLLYVSLGFSSQCMARSSTGLPWMAQRWFETATLRNYDNNGHTINKRQSMDEDEIPEDCSRELNRLKCQSGLQEKFVRLAENCGRNDHADYYALLCDRNEAGDVCLDYEFANENQLYFAYTNCTQLYPTPRSDSCPSEECANALQALRSNPAGCCIDSLNNITSLSVNDSTLGYTLWSQCGVETFEPCEKTITTTPVTNAKNCTDEEYPRQVYNLYCTGGLFNTILEQVEEMEGCSQIRTSYDYVCQVNSQGENCNYYIIMMYSGVEQAINECIYYNQASCSDGCREALETLRNEQGCCFNFFHNNTDAYPYEKALTNYTLWNKCGVETPPLTCRNLLSKAHGKDLAILTLVLCTLLVAMWNN